MAAIEPVSAWFRHLPLGIVLSKANAIGVQVVKLTSHVETPQAKVYPIPT